jgi:TolB-like protein/DNA-binding winged helix-turn-helix (wHTH) protein/Tfp pilus assembly protein PilF
LQEQPSQILSALLEQPGDVVTRDRLRERLWKSDTFVDYDRGLNTAVKKLRQALGDSAEAPLFIETLARRGYRFIGHAEPLAGPDPEPAAPPYSSETAPIAIGRRRRPNRAILWTAAAGLLSLGIVLLWRAQIATGTAATPDAGRSPTTQLAVMPFRVLTNADQDVAYLGPGLADAITTRLAATRQIGVRPTSAVLPFTGLSSEPAKVAASLGVGHLVVGTIQLSEQAYRVTVQLVRADGVAVWGHTFDEPRVALLRLQDRLAEQVVGALRIELGAPDRARLHLRYTDNPAAYDLYLRGRSLLVNYTEANMLEAITNFEQALNLDQNYALARTGIATASAWFSVRYAHESDALQWAKRAEDEARRALEQDGSLADAHLAIASAAGTAYGKFEWKIVLDRSAAALALDPSLDLAHLARMRAYYHLGLFEEASREGREAARLNPGHSVELDRLEVALLLFGGDYAKAVERAEPMLPLTDAPAVRHYLGLARYYAGDASGGRATLQSTMRIDSPDTRAQASLASIEAASGMQKEARARIAQIVRGTDLDHHVAYGLGAAYAQLGDPASSLTWLERAADTGFPCYPWFVRDSLLDPLRETPRFVQLLARLRDAQRDARRLRR